MSNTELFRFFSQLPPLDPSWSMVNALLWELSPAANRRRASLEALLPRIVVGPDGLCCRVPGRSGPGASPCWLWEGPTSGAAGRGAGYPRASQEGFTIAVHRWMWQLFYGPLPSKKQLDHCCRVRLCVNPTHLEPVTHLRNCRRRDEARAAGLVSA